MAKVNPLIILILVSGVIFSFLFWFQARHAELETAKLRYDYKVGEALDKVRKRMFDYEQVLRGGAALFAVSPVVTREIWRTYVTALHIEENFPGVQGFGYSQLIAPEDLGRHLHEIQQQGFPTYTIRPAQSRDIYTSIIFLEPFSGRNLKAFGYDMFTEPVRRAAMERARDSGQASLTGRVQLVQEAQRGQQAGTLIYYPIYRKGQPTNTKAERNAALQGYVYCPFRMDDLMTAALEKSAGEMALQLYDGDREDEQHLLFTKRIEILQELPHYRPTFSTLHYMEIAGRVWMWRIVTLPAFDVAQGFSRSSIILAGGLAGTFLVVILVLALGNTQKHAKKIAENLSEEYQQNVHHLHAILNTVIEGIISINESGMIENSNMAAQQIFGYSAKELQNQPMNLLIPEINWANQKNSDFLRFQRSVAGKHKKGRLIRIQIKVNMMRVGEQHLCVILLTDQAQIPAEADNLNTAPITV